MLPNYYHHVRTYDNTLITKFFGLHRVKPSSGQKVTWNSSNIFTKVCFLQCNLCQLFHCRNKLNSWILYKEKLILYFAVQVCCNGEHVLHRIENSQEIWFERVVLGTINWECWNRWEHNAERLGSWLLLLFGAFLERCFAQVRECSYNK